MPAGILEREAPVVAEKVLSIASKVTGVFDEGITAAKKVGKHTSDAVEEFIDDTAQRIKRHPTETAVGAFTAGLVIGTLFSGLGLLGWLMRRK